MDRRFEELVSLVTWESVRLGRWEAAIGSSKMFADYEIGKVETERRVHVEGGLA